MTEGTTALRGSAARTKGGAGRGSEGLGEGASKANQQAGGVAVARAKKSGGKDAAVSGGGVESAIVYKRIAWVVGFLAWLFVALSLASYSPTDPGTTAVPVNSPVKNLGGVVGALASHYVFYALVGYGAWVLVLLSGVALYVWASGRQVTQLAVRILGALLLAAVIATAQAIYFPMSGPATNLPGGIIGLNAGSVLTRSFRALAFMPLIVGLMIGAIVALDVWAMLAAAWTGRVLWTGAKHTGKFTGTVALKTAQTIAEKRALAKARAEEAEMEAKASAARGLGSVRETDVDDDEELADVAAEKIPASGKRGKKKVQTAAEKIHEDAGGLGATESFDPDGSGLPPAAPGIIEEDEEEIEDPDLQHTSGTPVPPGPAKTKGKGATGGTPVPPGPADEETEETAAAEEPKVFTPEELRAKIAKLPVRFAAQTKRSATDEDLRDIQNQQDLEGYRFPGLDLLEEPEGNFVQTMESYVREQAEALEKALKEYRIDGEVVGVESGPVITMYELRLAPGTKVAALSAVSSDLARALKSVNIRIVTNIAGRDTVGVEVPNAQKEKVRLKELMTKAEVYGNMRLPMFLGKDAGGEPMIEDLAKMPHMLIAGTTGSGKSVAMNTIIMSFLYTKKPNELKLVLVDPKMVEMSQFKDIPHLMCPVVTEMSKAAAILEWAVNKMDERYELLAEAGCRDLASYNELTWEELKDRFNPTTPEEEAKIPRKLPYMVFVIDELADLMMTNKEVEHSIVRIAQKARAVGMHLILATQRPQANVVTGLIKSNMPARIAFKVASGMDSRIVLDQKGGELLLGQGDMLYLSPKSSKLTRAQGTLVDDKEIRRVVKFMKEVASPTFERQLMQLRAPASATGEEGGEIDAAASTAAQDDPMFDKAVEVVLETKRGSVSMLQRRLAIGYTRASRLIDAMGLAGIVGEHKGTVEREVMLTIDEWRAMKAQAEADAAEAEKGELSRPIADSLEVAQSIVNDGNTRENLESARKATEEIEEDDEATDEIEDADESDDSDEDRADDDAPFEVKTKVGPGAASRK
jgi:S-DNA-T family DNA segregation ATPase FtsK/SpoIIIE